MIISPAQSRHEPNAPSPVTLPDDLIAEILSLLTVKSLMRLQCVRKSWNSIISDPIFVKMHLTKSSRNPHITLLMPYSYDNSTISLIDICPVHRLLDYPINLFNYEIVGYCNGLICFIDIIHTVFYLWNPATVRLSEKLDSFGIPCYFEFSFGYDNLTNKYKVVAFGPNKDVRVLTLGDCIWRNIQSFPSYHCTRNHENYGVYLSNSLNWLALAHLDNPFDYYRQDFEQFEIISLDLGTETYTQFRLPQCLDEVPMQVEPIVCVLMECLCFSHYCRGCKFVIWQMTEFGVEKSWTKLLTFSYMNVLISCKSSLDYRLWPLHVFENGDSLILACNGQKLIRYNRRDNRVVGKTTITNTFHSIFAIHYVESLISTCLT